MTTIGQLEAQYLPMLQGPGGRLSYWNDYRQQVEVADDYPGAAYAMTYVIGSNKEVRLQPLYTPDWKTIPVHTNAETAKQFAREVFRIALGVYPENYTGGLIGVTVSSEDLSKLSSEAQQQYLSDNPNVVVLPPAEPMPTASGPMPTPVAPSSSIPAPLPDSGTLPTVSGPIRPSPALPTGGVRNTVLVEPAMPMVQVQEGDNAPAPEGIMDKLRKVPIGVWALFGLVGILVFSRAGSRS